MVGGMPGHERQGRYEIVEGRRRNCLYQKPAPPAMLATLCPEGRYLQSFLRPRLPLTQKSALVWKPGITLKKQRAAVRDEVNPRAQGPVSTPLWRDLGLIRMAGPTGTETQRSKLGGLG